MVTCRRCDEDGTGPTGKCPTCAGNGEIISKRCPKSWLDHEAHDFLFLVSQMQDGLPPLSGGLLSQEAYFVDCLRIFNDERVRIERDRQRKRKKSKK